MIGTNFEIILLLNPKDENCDARPAIFEIELPPIAFVSELKPPDVELPLGTILISDCALGMALLSV